MYQSRNSDRGGPLRMGPVPTIWARLLRRVGWVRLVLLALVGWAGFRALRTAAHNQVRAPVLQPVAEPAELRIPQSLLRPGWPHRAYKDALVAGTDYITSGQAHGNSNQILSVLKLIHLATLLDRVPILASLSGAAHNEGPPIPLSTFYNLTHLSRKVGQPLLEWHQVKDPSLGPAEPLGCWRTVPRGGGEPALTQSGLKPEYWAIPPQLGTPTYRSLVQLSTDTQLTTDWVASERHRLGVAGEDAPEAEPDGHLLCFDQHLRTWEQTRVDGTKIEKEALQDLDPLGPAWALVGQHLRWNDRLAALADQVKAELLGSASRPYLAVHLRQGDFIQQRRTQPGLIEPFVDGVAAVQARLVAQKGAGWAALPVVFATDSEDEDYLNQLKELGWLHLDHARWQTKERLGGWYPAHLDLAVLSGASGFVGSRLSSFSSLTARRVESWQGGPTVDVFAPNKPRPRPAT